MYLRDVRVFQDDRGDVMKMGRRVVKWRAKERRAFIALGVGKYKSGRDLFRYS